MEHQQLREQSAVDQFIRIALKKVELQHNIKVLSVCQFPLFYQFTFVMKTLFFRPIFIEIYHLAKLYVLKSHN